MKAERTTSLKPDGKRRSALKSDVAADSEVTQQKRLQALAELRQIVRETFPDGTKFTKSDYRL